MTTQYDVVVIGAGAAGMMCAAVAGQRGKSVLLIDHAGKLAGVAISPISVPRRNITSRKIRISAKAPCHAIRRRTF